MKQASHKFFKKLSASLLLFVLFVSGMIFVLPRGVNADVCGATCVNAETLSKAGGQIGLDKICVDQSGEGAKMGIYLYNMSGGFVDCPHEITCGLGTSPLCCCRDNYVALDEKDTEKADATGFIMNQERPKYDLPELQVSIPGLKFDEVNCVNNSAGNFTCSIFWISNYVSAIYNYALTVAGILAAIMLMAGGLLWLTSGGDASKISKAKTLIGGSVTGLVILFSAYMILYEINPELTKLKPIVVGEVSDNMNVMVASGSDSAENIITQSCLTDNELVNIQNIKNVSVSGNVSDPRLSQGAYNALTKAGEIAGQEGLRLMVTSANRTYAKQVELWKAALAKHGSPEIARKYVAHPDKCKVPTCSGHCGGLAVDLCIEGSSSCSKINSENAKLNNSETQKLEEIMNKAGFGRYCGEWWHFQTNLANRPCS